MNKLRYNLDNNGNISEIGYVSSYDIEVTNEPFGMGDSVNWRKDLDTGEWIYLPDITPVDKTITNVTYDWQAEKAYITIADQFNPGPHEFDCTTTWTEQDCINAINQKFL